MTQQDNKPSTEHDEAAKPTVPEVLPIVRALYRKAPAGGCFHSVFDDGNTGPKTVRSCIEHHQANRDCASPEECDQLSRLLPLMSRTQISKLAGDNDSL